ncbi:peptidoglycan-binding domain-containing protein [Streptomyces mutomycini]|uniref:Peptidoglycan-binding protein n=1 Tax=Streptomyces mutomycini TaxID=284036 RepID=A0ABW0BBN9_9ACTN|nr:peptidoglycan-binding domain-containing protein [Streptomyces mutomycini]
MTGQMCPECGGEQSARPGAGCACGAGAATRGGQEARSAETAAAEDFDPLRIRPYVTLHSDDTQDHGAPAAATTMPLFLDGVAGGAPGPAPGPLPGAAVVDETRRRRAAAYPGDGDDPVQPRRRRPFAVIAVGAAVAAVVGTAAFAGGLFDGEDSTDTALPEVTTSTPDAGGEPAASVSTSSSATPSATPSRSASASPSATASPSASPTPSRSAVASKSPTPSASATKAPTTAATPLADEASGATLRLGDRGAEVSELQRRLQEVWVYRGPEDGDYSERVEEAVAEYQRWVSVTSDPPGVYGPETRRALEAQTSGRGRHRS